MVLKKPSPEREELKRFKLEKIKELRDIQRRLRKFIREVVG
jgi:hypothetical protein